MKSNSKIKILAASISVILSLSVNASKLDSLYKNVYDSTINDQIEYSIELHNPFYGELEEEEEDIDLPINHKVTLFACDEVLTSGMLFRQNSLTLSSMLNRYYLNYTITDEGGLKRFEININNMDSLNVIIDKIIDYSFLTIIGREGEDLHYYKNVIGVNLSIENL